MAHYVKNGIKVGVYYWVVGEKNFYNPILIGGNADPIYQTGQDAVLTVIKDGEEPTIHSPENTKGRFSFTNVFTDKVEITFLGARHNATIYSDFTSTSANGWEGPRSSDLSNS